MQTPRVDRPDILFLPPIGALGAPLMALLLEWLVPLPLLPAAPAPALRFAGIALILGAIALGGWGVVTFRKARTNVDPRQPALVLVDTGPFRFTRNPMYLGMVVLQVGIALAASLDWALIFAPVLWAALHFGVVLREEAYLTAKFGTPYRDFLSRTRRWI